jgi:hypothetical protein
MNRAGWRYQLGGLTGSRSSRSRRLQKRSDWTFKSFEDGSWGWHVAHIDGSEQSSPRTFLTKKECIADATRHGYVAWIPEAERRGSK